MPKHNTDIENIYPLSPMQEGMVFHTLHSSTPGAYVTQLVVGIQGELSTENLRKAWDDTVARHTMLRTAVVSTAKGRYLQVVHKSVRIPWTQLDWRGANPEEKQKLLDEFLAADRLNNFDLAKAPLMRMAILRLDQSCYRLVWTHHHLLLDGWSVPIVLGEMLQLYAAYSQGKKLSLAKPRPYADYIAWLQKQNLGDAERHWRNQLAGFDTPTLLNVHRIDAEGRARTMEREELLLSENTTTALERFVARERLTMNTLVQAAWGLLLCRYNGESDVVFGATTAGRPAELADAEQMVGLFINTLPVRFQARREENLIDTLKRLQQQQTEARQFEYSPLVQIRNWSEMRGASPLFESIVVFENYPVVNQQTKHSPVALEHFEINENTGYPITLLAGPGKRMMVRIEYDASIFSVNTIRRLLEHYQQLMTEVAEGGAERRISELSLLSGEEREQVVRGWNGESRREYELAACLQQRFEEQAKRCPEAVALRHQGQKMSYRELEQKSNQVARYLRKRGVGAEERVGICLQRGMEMIVAMLGVLKAGGAYVPLDPGYPEERLRYMAEDAEARVVLAQREVRERLGNEIGVEVVCWEEAEEEMRRESVERLERVSGGENAAYVIYTSGSTGKPKGTVIRHSSAVTLVEWAGEEYGEEELAGVLAGTSICFDLSVYEIFVPLSFGGAVIVAGNVLELGWLEEKEEVRLINTVPSAMKELVRIGGVPAGVRTVNLAGEALKRELVEEIYGKTETQRVVNLYGPTEDTTYSTYAEMKRGEKGVVKIGRPIANTQVYVVDEGMGPVGVGMVGEIYLGGAGLGRGYWKRGELTAERYVANPFSQEGGERLYRTGDLGRYGEDGGIEYLGRKDEQVKVRGYRIELGEIERVLEEHAGVREAVVVVREHSGGEGAEGEVEKQLVAYVVKEGKEGEQGESGVSGVELREYLRGRLPEALVPGVYVEISELPLTPNGKVDRKRLPAPEQQRQRAIEVGYTGPRTEVEEVMCGIWAEVLGLERVGIHDNFFELGGDSLLATQVIARVRDAFQI